MIPIPKYLDKHVTLIRSKDNTILLSFHCDCGSDKFTVAKNVFNRSERALLKPYYDSIKNSLSRYGSYCTLDDEGKLHHWKRLSDDRNDVIEVFLLPEPDFATVTVLKAKCSGCGKEHILFDNRSNGYDAMTSDEHKGMDYIPHFNHYSKKEYALEIKIENDETFEIFKKNTGIDCSEEFYSDAFSWIIIYGIDEDGKRRKLFEFETA